MLKNLIPLLLAFTLIFVVSAPMFAQESSKPDAMKDNTAPSKAAEGGKEEVQAARWSGYVVRSSKDNSTLTVRKRGGSAEKVIYYDNSTQWETQEHGNKKANKIDPSEVKDGDRVIILGIEDKSGFHATVISKRLAR